jgi:hypothetical protein
MDARGVRAVADRLEFELLMSPTISEAYAGCLLAAYFAPDADRAELDQERAAEEGGS